MAWYAKFDGVDGSALHKDHKAWSNVVSVNMGGHKAGGGGTGVGRIGGKMHLEDISMGIITDKALPKLLEAAVKGKCSRKSRFMAPPPTAMPASRSISRLSWRTCRLRPSSLAFWTIMRPPMT